MDWSKFFGNLLVGFAPVAEQFSALVQVIMHILLEDKDNYEMHNLLHYDVIANQFNCLIIKIPIVGTSR